MVSFSAKMIAELAQSNLFKESFDPSDLELYGFGLIAFLVGEMREARRPRIEIEYKSRSRNLIE